MIYATWNVARNENKNQNQIILVNDGTNFHTFAEDVDAVMSCVFGTDSVNDNVKVYQIII